MPTHEPYAYWKAALAWRADPKAHAMPDFNPKKPETGFYRGQRNEAVAIWWRDQHGPHAQCMARVHRPGRTQRDQPTVQDYKHADQIGDSVFAYCCRNPVTFEVYKKFTETGLWPEDVGSVAEKSPGLSTKAAPSVNTPGPEPERIPSATQTQSQDDSATPEKKFSSEITALIASAEQWLDSVGRKIETQVSADKLANYAVEAQAIEDRAEAARVAEKRPIDEAARAVQARWVPLITAASGLKRNLKTMLQPWLMAQARKAAQEAVDAQKAREAAEVAGTLPPAATEPPSRSVAGTRGRVSLKTRKVYDIENLREAAEFIAKLNDPPSDFVEGVRSAATLLIKAGVKVPGVVVKTESGVA